MKKLERFKGVLPVCSCGERDVWGYCRKYGADVISGRSSAWIVHPGINGFLDELLSSFADGSVYAYQNMDDRTRCYEKIDNLGWGADLPDDLSEKWHAKAFLLGYFYQEMCGCFGEPEECLNKHDQSGKKLFFWVRTIGSVDEYSTKHFIRFFSKDFDEFCAAVSGYHVKEYEAAGCPFCESPIHVVEVSGFKHVPDFCAVCERSTHRASTRLRLESSEVTQ